MGTERSCEVAPQGFVARRVGQEKTPAVGLCNRKTLRSPLLNRPVKTKEIIEPAPQGEGLLPAGAIEVDQKGLASGHQDILELEISVEESCMMKVPNEAAHAPDHLALFDQVLRRRTVPDLQKTAGQVFCLGDFEAEKISPVEEREDGLVNGAHRLNGRDSGSPDFFCEGKLLKSP